MKINHINFLNKIDYSQKSNNQVKQLRYIKFGGSQNQINPNIKTSVNFGLELFNNPENTEEIISKYGNDVEILTIDESVRKKIGDTDACIFFNREKGTFNPINIKIYATNPPKIKTKWNKLAYATVFAHEFTHYMQIKSKENKKLMMNLSDNNFDYLRMLMPIGDGIFDEFDGMKFRFTDRVFNFIDKISEKIYSFPLARKKQFKKEDIFVSGGVKNQEEFNKYISDKFNKIFSRTLSIILFEEDSADESIVDFVKENVQSKEKLMKLKNDLKAYCSAKAKYEREAYKTESELAKKVLKTNKSLNIDSYIMYYSMLENALK